MLIKAAGRNHSWGTKVIVVGAIIIAACLAGSFALWDPLGVDERSHVRELTTHVAKIVREDLAEEMQSRLQGRVRLADHWAESEPVSGNDLNGKLFLEQYPEALQLPGVTWQIRVWPGPELLGQIRSPLPELAAVLGALLVLMCMLIIRCASTAQFRAKELYKETAQLEQQVVSRSAALRRSNESLRQEIAERRKVEDSLRKLSGRLLQLQDEERRRIARELHDSTTQLVAAITIDLENALSAARDCTKLEQLLPRSLNSLKLLKQELRTLSYLLHPPLLDELGLESALRWFADGLSERSGIAVDLTIDENLGRLEYEIELTIFRITQEALTNVHLHSGSGTATVRLSRDSSSATLEISDQGSGLPADWLHATTMTPGRLGVGIAGMRERVNQLAGQFQLTSSHSGTLIRVVLPLSATFPEANAAAFVGDTG